jgi:tagatose-1,6-bisphosphate aldolase
MFTRTVGKIRGLQQCATPAGKFAILALDHRNNLRNLLRMQNQNLDTQDMMTAFKHDVVTALADVSSAFLLDPLYGAAQNIVSQTLPGNLGLLVALEETGYLGDPSARQSQILPDWSVAKVRRMGGSAVKLLVYYHPNSSTHTRIEDLIKQVADDCQKEDIPLFLEVLTYALDPAQKKLEGDERQDVILESAEKLTPLGADVLKAEFPLDISMENDFDRWEAACSELTGKSVIPWILLSASVDFDVFLRQVMAACVAGASGVAVGRAVWKEATALGGQDRVLFLQTVARERMRRIMNLVDALAAPWTSHFEVAQISEEWFRTYPEE